MRLHQVLISSHVCFRSCPSPVLRPCSGIRLLQMSGQSVMTFIMEGYHYRNVNMLLNIFLHCHFIAFIHSYILDNYFSNMNANSLFFQ